MKFKGTYILLVIFLGLGAYLYFTEYRGREERQKLEEAKKRVFSVDAKDIAEIRLEYPDRTIAAVRKGEQWEMTLPPGMEAASEEWDSLASSIALVEKEETVTADEVELTAYGLDKPQVKVTAKVQGDNPREIGVLFGHENPKKTFRYAKLHDAPEVFLAANSWPTTFTKSVADLRNKTVLEIESDGVDSVKIAAAGRPEIELQKSGAEWVLKKPVETAADTAEVSSFISSIQFSQASDFADSAMDARKAGVEPPEVRITLHDQKTSADRVLLIGKSAGEGLYFVKDQARPVIFIMAADIVEKARRPVFDWRDKTVAKFNRDSIDEIEITRGQEKLIARKKGEEWNLADGRKVQPAKISEMLSNLEFEKAVAIQDGPPAAAPGLNPGRLRVVLRESGKDVVDLAFGGESAKPEGIYARLPSKPVVFVVSKSLYDTFNTREGDLIENPAPAAPVAK